MSSPPARPRYSYMDYIALEAVATTKHEFVGGEIYALVGGTPEHAALAAAFIGIVSRSLPAGCRAFTSDLRIRIPTTGLSTYPDAAVVCGPVERATDDPQAVVNPTLIVEVTSDSTEAYDRTEKLRHYTQLAALQVVLIVSHRERRVTVHRRTAAGWPSNEETGACALDPLPLTLQVDELYSRSAL